MTRPVKGWEFSLSLDDKGREPLFVQIVRAISADIQRGRLKPGAVLPGSRGLAEKLAVHRNTVLAAYQELLAEGWIESFPGRGTFVARSLPQKMLGHKQSAPTRGTFPPPLGVALRSSGLTVHPQSMEPGILNLSGGAPDLRFLPVAPLARAYRLGLRQNARLLLAYRGPEGHPRLRAALAQMLRSTRGLAISAEDVLVTRGAQMAFDLVGRALLQPGDRVAVEEFGYSSAWRAFQQHGAELVPIAVDGEGLRVDKLEEVLKAAPIRAVYLTPHHQVPTTVTLAAPRRMALLQLAARHKFAIIEDDYDYEFHYQGRPVLPLASSDRAGVVVYIGTLSKILAPGLRIGYAVAPRILLQQMAAHRFYLDRQGDSAVEFAVAELLDDGEVQRHAHRARRMYQRRRDFLMESLTKGLGTRISFQVPSGGMSLWIRVQHGMDVEKWATNAQAFKVLIQTARSFAFDGRAHPFIRLGFAALNENELAEGVDRLRRAVP